MHNDSHCSKMIIEYAQLMSTAHRVLDGEKYYGLTKNGRKIARWKLNSNMEEILYKASHINHPSAIWARSSNNNYNWLYCLFTALCDEYTHRYGKVHACTEPILVMCELSEYLPEGELTEFVQAMPDEYKNKDAVKAYREYYNKDKNQFAQWKLGRAQPQWYNGSNR